MQLLLYVFIAFCVVVVVVVINLFTSVAETSFAKSAENVIVTARKTATKTKAQQKYQTIITTITTANNAQQMASPTGQTAHYFI